MFTLRDYQNELIDNVRKSISKGNHTIIVQSPPRTGKTVTMAEIARIATSKGNRCLFLVHRKEIIAQARNTFEIQQCDMNLVDFMMVQTAYKRVNILSGYDVIFVDEGHHALAKTYQTVLNKYPQAIKLLFTATPQRTGKRQLDEIAEDIVLGKSIKQLTNEGNLAKFKYYSIDYADKNKLKKSSSGDFTTKSMDSSLDNKIYGDVVDHYLKYAKGKQAVVYCYSVETAKEFADVFNHAGISAVEVDGSTPTFERDAYVEAFRNGEIQIMTNVNLFTEGLDLPNVDCVIMVRPTASLALYLQFAMRCLNPREGKEAVIIDHVGNWQRFGLPDSERDWVEAMTTVEKGNRRQSKQSETRVKQCDYCFACFDPKEMKDSRCPICGELLKVDYSLKQAEAELVEINKVDYEKIYNNVMNKPEILKKRISELTTYKELQQYAEAKGYKKGWVYHQAKIKGLI